MIRLGFVSNSSSSSFIISCTRFDIRTMCTVGCLTPQQEQLLEDYGFHKTSTRDALKLECTMQYEPVTAETQTTSYGLCVSCNQDDVVQFLIQHNIPFKAACHYGNYEMFWAGDEKDVVVAENFGRRRSVYGDSMDKYKGFFELNPERRYSPKEWKPGGVFWLPLDTTNEVLNE